MLFLELVEVEVGFFAVGDAVAVELFVVGKRQIDLAAVSESSQIAAAESSIIVDTCYHVKKEFE